MSLSKEKDDSFFQRTLQTYLHCLKKYPILTKSCTSAITGGIGNLLSQIIIGRGQSFDLRSWSSFVIMGFGFIGPAMHYAYKLMEQLIPQKTPYFALRRLLLERLILTPIIMLGYLYFLYLIQLRDPKIAALQLMVSFRQVLITNWKVWTIFQFINVNYIPQQYRVLFGNAVALGWNVYMTVSTKQAMAND